MHRMSAEGVPLFSAAMDGIPQIAEADSPMSPPTSDAFVQYSTDPCLGTKVYSYTRYKNATYTRYCVYRRTRSVGIIPSRRWIDPASPSKAIPSELPQHRLPTSDRYAKGKASFLLILLPDPLLSKLKTASNISV